MSALDKFFRIGETIILGAHLFTPEAIKAFASKYDPQPFHMDEEKARNSVLGGLCASGWHTASTWMKYNLKQITEAEQEEWKEEGPRPIFGPSPGFENLKWLKPVYAGETITFTRQALAHRALASRPGWRVLTLHCEGINEKNEKVLEFVSSVLVKTA